MATPSIAPVFPSHPSPGLRAALALIGFSAVVAQVVLLRELMVVFYGNEMSAGLMLASWLFWTAFGSGVLGRITGRIERPWRLMAWLEILIAVALPATIFAVRASRGFFHALPGETLGPVAMLLTSVATLSLFCSLSGWLFTAGARLYGNELDASTAAATASVYLLEAIGSAFGGLLASLLLVPRVEAFAIALLVSVLNGTTAAWLLLRKKPWGWAVVLLVFAGIATILPLASNRLERASRTRLWRGMSVVSSRDSQFGNLVVIQNEGSRTLYENGLPMFTVPDPAAAEEAVHYALLQHPAPRRLLLIGGGINGSVLEALKHPTLEHVDYVELDPEVFRLANQYFAGEWRSLSADPRVRIINGDGRRFLKTSRDHWDVILVNLPEPQTAQLNRFYTREFFREAREKLNAGGLVSLQLRSSENYLSPERAEFLRCIYRTLTEVFPEAGFIPGETVHLFGGNRSLAPNTAEMLARLRQRQVAASYVGEYFLPFRMMPDRMAEMRETLRAAAPTPVNRDFAPVAYYFGVALWSTQFNHAYRGGFAALAHVRFGALIAVLATAAVLLLAGVLSVARGRRRATAAAALCVGSMGFTLIGLEVLLLLGFQAMYGYVYRQLTVLIAMFMAGMAVGSWSALRKNLGVRALAILQIAAVAAPLGLYAVLQILARLTMAGPQLQRDYVGETAFVALAIAAGILGGLQFAAASRTRFAADAIGDHSLPPEQVATPRGKRRYPDSRHAGATGTLYAFDVLGACAGAIVITAYLVPVFGFARAAAVMAVVAAGPAVLAVVSACRAAGQR